MQTTSTLYTDGGIRRQARRGLAVYFGVVLALSAPIQAVIIAADLGSAPTTNYGSHRERPRA
jgi:hypothetical protein